MEAFHPLTRLWPKIKPILLPYDGAASQVHVLDVPSAELGRAIDLFCQRAETAEIFMLDDYSFPAEQKLTCNSANRARLLKAAGASQISGTFTENRAIQFYIWPQASGASFDAELVFFGDTFFDGKADDDDLRSSFELVYTIAEGIRANHPASQCVVTSHETGDPRQSKADSQALFW